MEIEIKFTKYCKTGYIDGIKKMSLNCDLSYGFLLACRYGNYDIVKYLAILYKTENSNDMIDRDSIEEGFIEACIYGYYDIVLYLVELYKIGNSNDIYTGVYYQMISIQSLNEGFKYAYNNKHYKIVKYLMTIYKKHKYKPFNNYLIIFYRFNKFMFH